MTGVAKFYIAQWMSNEKQMLSEPQMHQHTDFTFILMSAAEKPAPLSLFI